MFCYHEDASLVLWALNVPPKAISFSVSAGMSEDTAIGSLTASCMASIFLEEIDSLFFFFRRDR